MSNVLFDVPGPKARLRYRTYAVVGTLVVLAFLGYIGWRFYDSGQFTARKWEWLQYAQVQRDLGNAVLSTLQAFAAAAVLALIFGAIFAAGRLSDHAWVRGIAGFVVEFFRAIPALILMFVFYFGLPTVGVPTSPFLGVVFGLTLYNGSVLAEVFRAGIQSLPKGQSEAAYALGMRKTQVMFLVLLPQAVRAMLPTIISQLVVLLKDTALGFIITYQELLYYARYIGSQGTFGRPIVPSTIVATAIYVVMCLLLTALATYLERRNRRSKKVIAAPPTATEDLVAASA
ncbi:amino acid ABC transporter permease [Amycolatopsis mediterranei S699]|uniref:Permease component of ABC-type amino acid transport system n=1 Tax=Amycolatopsis mediterranei (strain U-32) TaxID=749927 RepID=A0A0H3D1S9_AMYMU|nr:amino acid ABC transporter permease [Amycolatopsis mediterranei]ADJ44156.1 permease component of ABC-type amino acid transport system [Amycolatopsis mediterranei U32]AFO75869.1 amino acid ABC transporter permease [Amycolatopsis mediterranei S699]AGT82998.1 amino acid ABC transporter permease [Amycolatopsis mediterranei RB]KDO06926.1 amino acid ABC transporter permease [Amycolatopsis mediterranei]KDU92165.1 amino acid ABC transporter permease [Amycolatopsis mediterranei]